MGFPVPRLARVEYSFAVIAASASIKRIRVSTCNYINIYDLRWKIQRTAVRACLRVRTYVRVRELTAETVFIFRSGGYVARFCSYTRVRARARDKRFTSKITGELSIRR